jgi:TPR repeat protein
MTESEIEDMAYAATQKQEYDAAISLLTPLAAKNSVFALETLGWIYANGDASVLDYEQAGKHYHRALALGSLNGYLHLGWLRMCEEKFADARFLFEKGQKNGGEGLEHALDVLALQETESLAREAMDNDDYRQAFTLLTPYAANDSEYVLMTLGWLYHSGKGGVTDLDLAVSLYERAAAIGRQDSHYYIGTLELSRGHLEAARAAFGEVAFQEDWASMSMLGEMMIAGRGGPKQVAEGIIILTSSADQGHIMSRVKLLSRELHLTHNPFKKISIIIKSLSLILTMAKVTLQNINSPRTTEFFS